jgi:hypothetical protein
VCVRDGNLTFKRLAFDNRHRWLVGTRQTVDSATCRIWKECFESKTDNKDQSALDHEENSYSLEGRADQIQGSNLLIALHQRLASESIDALWAPRVESLVQEKMSNQMSSGLQLVSVRCASTICEIQGIANNKDYNSAAFSGWTDAIGEIKHAKSLELAQDIGVNEVGIYGHRVFITFFSRVSGAQVYDPSGNSAENSGPNRERVQPSTDQP